MRDQSLPGGPRLTASAPGSQATSDPVANQDKSLLANAHAFSTETASEHLRNALQILLHGSVPETALAAVDRRLVDALLLLEPGTASHLLIDAAAALVTARAHLPVARRLLRNGLEYLELHAAAATPTYSFRITAAGIDALTESPSCEFCGCTEFDPCEIPRALLGKSEVARWSDFAGVDQPLPEILPCSWLDIDAFVCSHPECVAKLEAKLASIETAIAQDAWSSEE